MISKLINATLILIAFTALPLAAQDAPTTAPTTQSTGASSYQVMDKNRLKFLVPEGWTRTGASSDETTIRYVTDRKDGVILFNNSPQSAPLGPGMRVKMAQEIMKKLNEALDKQKAEMTLRPVQEKDDRFYLRFRMKFLLNGNEADQIVLYKVEGLNLIMATITGTSASKDRNKEILEQGEAMLLSFSQHQPGNPLPKDVAGAVPAPNGAGKIIPSRASGFSKGRIRLMTPTGWKEDKTDQPRGIVATYEDTSGSNVITVSVRPIAKNIAADEALRKIFIDETVASAQASVTIKDAKVGKPETIPDDKVLRKIRVVLELSTAKIIQTTRVVLVGDTIVTVTSLAPESDADAVDKVASDLTASVQPMGTITKGP
jgi:hypothetical protein